MPQINRIRVNNVKYNFGTQFYDDFLMRFSGKNTIYDLANGGGKSVLMLLLMQNMIPNCTLDDKQPIEKLFRTGNGSNTIHSLVEWKLSDVHIRNNYKYMLTGFCARKARDEEKTEEEGASIDYFNYVIFYREYNDHDIRNLPLSVPSAKNPKVKERITYNGLKNYLRELERKDFSLEVKIFERKGDYQRFIAGYGIYESEWEIIRGINKTEGHVRTYFESNYKTTRKVVEDLLIEEIIEKSFKNRILTSENAEKHENVMVETLMEIKDKLLELSAKKEDIHNYDRQVELLQNFADRVGGIKKLYFGQETMERELAAGYHSLQAVIAEKEAQAVREQEKLVGFEQQRLAEQRAIDTVKLQESEEQAQKLEEELTELWNQEENLEKQQEQLKADLTMAESVNDYLDYLYYKAERDSVRESIERMNEDKSELLAELTALAAEKKYRKDAVFENLQQQLEEENAKAQKEQDMVREMEGRREELLRELAVSGYRIEEYEREIESCNGQITEWKRSADLLMVFDLQKELSGCGQECKLFAGKQKENQEKTEKAAEKFQQAEKELVARSELAQELDEKLEENIEGRALLAKAKERFEKLKTVYNETNGRDLYEKLCRKLAGTEKIIEEKELETGQKQAEKQGLEMGCPVAESKAVKTVLTYIQRYHAQTAKSGTELLMQAEPDRRRELVEQAPLLPYAVVVWEQYAAVSEDGALAELGLGNEVVPIISGQALEQGEYLIDDHMTYAGCAKELFFDGKAQAVQLATVENKLLELDAELVRLRDNVQVYGKDIEFIREFLQNQEPQLAAAEAEYEDLKSRRRENEVLLRQTEESLENIRAEQAELEKQKTELAEQAEETAGRYQIIENIISHVGKVRELEKNLSSAYQAEKSAKQEFSNLAGRIQAWKDKAEANQKQYRKMKAQEGAIAAEWEQYRRFWREETVRTAQYEADTDEELEAKFKGAVQVYDGGSSDLADKQKLLDNYELAMDKSLQAIDYKGVDAAEIRKCCEQNTAYRTEREELLEYKQKIDEKNKALKTLKKTIADKKSEKDRLEGAANNGREAIIRKYGSFERIAFPKEKTEDFIREKHQALQLLKQREEELKQSGKDLEKVRRQYELLLHDIDKVLTDEIRQRYENETFEITEGLTGRVEKSISDFARFREEIQNRREQFEKEKNQLIQTLQLMKCLPLADEISSNADMPGSVADTEQLIKGLEDIISCLNLEKNRIRGSIENMEMIKENFESQCLQSCVNIRTELEKLPKLSRIVMDGESIPVISLHIPYAKEELYKERMAAYIDETVEQADMLKSEAERVKYIKGRLSWKRMFAVIVTDMNAIRLNLYKRERMKEQSRYLKYEEAVGSTGQSQGIYIQFLIAMINYIASIYSRDTDSTSLRKVIFIDNPFGAAKDIYIWEPIFKMLKTNNVQLIVPCRGATPAITGRFDVNYVLGQKLVDGRQQTVVVDYYSNVDSEKLDYTTMTYEQGTFDFENGL